MKEHRLSLRVDAPYFIRLKGADICGCKFTEETLLENLSSGGLYLVLTRRLREGSDVTMAIRLSIEPATSVPMMRLAARGTVLRVEQRPAGLFGVAVEFKRRRVL
jgi:hypothetical protein